MGRQPDDGVRQDVKPLTVAALAAREGKVQGRTILPGSFCIGYEAKPVGKVIGKHQRFPGRERDEKEVLG